MKQALWLFIISVASPVLMAAEAGDNLAIDYRITNVDITDTNGVRSIVLSCVGEVEGYGHVRGTATLRGVNADATGGPSVWRAMAMNPQGVATDISPGSWQIAGPHSFRIRNISNISDGTALLGDVIVNLKEGTMKGAATILE